MKNLFTFEEFLSESKTEIVNEINVFAPANIKKYNLNKTSISKLKKWSYQIKDIEIKFVAAQEGWRDYTPDFVRFLEGTYYNTSYSSFSVNGEFVSINISYKPGSKLGFYESEPPNQRGEEFGIKESEFSSFIGEADDKIDGFIRLLNHLFKTYENEVYELYRKKLNRETLYVIPVGEIAPATGKTPHKWSIYDQPTSMLGILKNDKSAIISAAGMKIGDRFKLVNDQTHKLIDSQVEIEDLIPCNYDSYVRYCKSRGYEIPVGAFQKQTGKGRLYLYSIK